LLRTRILTGIVLAIIVGVSVLGLPTRYASLVFALFWLAGAGEWARLAGFAWPGQVVYGGLFAALVAAVLILGAPARMATATFWLAAFVWLGTFGLVLRFPRPLAAAPIAIVGIVVLFAAWLAFYAVHGAGARGPALILTGLVIVWSADIGAFFVGRSLGRTPLAPRVSPKKTWEGVAGGVMLATIAGITAAWLLDLSLAVLGITAAAMALISVVGDLGVSMLKRRVGLKDAGVLLPGHGGIMDRFDGVTAALPFFALGLQFAHVLD
jgi:phosphatidate cytidylyltransferase